ncbi:MAG: hypothetical protein NXI31_07660 [bacterium]|nr:hypothetical protein [bacterium]
MLHRLATPALSCALVLGSLASCSGSSGGGAAAFDANTYIGTWTGTWTNTTFTSTGAVTMTVSQSGSTFNVAFDMDGNVFGGANPALENFSATIASTNADLVSITSSVYGTVTGSLASDGTLTLNGTGIPGAVDRFALTGSWGASQITANVTITFDNSSVANGTATLTKT